MGYVRSDQRSTFFSSFHHNQRITKASDDPVSGREIMRIGLCPKWIFGDQASMADHFFCNFFMRCRIDHINTTAQYAYRRQTIFQSTFVSQDIDTISEPTDDENLMWYKADK